MNAAHSSSTSTNSQQSIDCKSFLVKKSRLTSKEAPKPLGLQKKQITTDAEAFWLSMRWQEKKLSSWEQLRAAEWHAAYVTYVVICIFSTHIIALFVSCSLYSDSKNMMYPNQKAAQKHILYPASVLTGLTVFTQAQGCRRFDSFMSGGDFSEDAAHLSGLTREWQGAVAWTCAESLRSLVIFYLLVAAACGWQMCDQHFVNRHQGVFILAVRVWRSTLHARLFFSSAGVWMCLPSNLKILTSLPRGDTLPVWWETVRQWTAHCPSFVFTKKTSPHHIHRSWSSWTRGKKNLGNMMCYVTLSSFILFGVSCLDAKQRLGVRNIGYSVYSTNPHYHDWL